MVNHSSEDSGFWQQAPNWGQFVASVLAILITLVLAIYANNRTATEERRDLERRLVTLEERQRANVENIAQEKADRITLQHEISDKLDGLRVDIQSLALKLEVHQARIPNK